MRVLQQALLVVLACVAVSCKKPQATDIPGRYNRLRAQGGEFLDLEGGRHLRAGILEQHRPPNKPWTVGVSSEAAGASSPERADNRRRSWPSRNHGGNKR